MALSKKEYKIITLLVIDTVFFLLEIIVGYMVNSLALIADSFHMLNDIISLIVALWAVSVAKTRTADGEYTYGWLRAEILGALINAVFLIALCFTIFIEAVQRLLDPPVITNPVLILVVGSFGLLSNIVGLFLFHDHGHSHGGDSEESGHSHSHGINDEENLITESSHYSDNVQNHDHAHSHGEENVDTHPVRPRSRSIYSKHATAETTPLLQTDSSDDLRKVLPSYVVNQLNSSPDSNNNGISSRKKKGNHKSGSLNMQGVFLHVLGDALGNIGVISTALLIWKTNYSWRFYFDPIISLLISCIIFSSAVPLCKRSSRILLQGTPLTIETSDVIKDVLCIPSVLGVHDFHIWNLTERLLIASLHVELDCSPENFLQVAADIKTCLHDYGIHSATIQPEFSAFYEKQKMLPTSYSSINSQSVNNNNNNKNNLMSDSAFNISSTHLNQLNNTSNPTSSSGTNDQLLNKDIHCLVDARANCTTSDCLK
ncbi:hypothetical protein CANINC_002972 [Pichia inconspicua]|uniref:Uncharacterized protein n=1 Tax=Pichia inconspicua TaxID=52247 RepID=A0A4T0WZV0_9ASCO|nr:hypothetical protein CANINC_002972 [[Candida] inconspicua]